MIVVLHTGDRGRDLFIDHANVDSLRKTYFEFSRDDFADVVPPASLAKEVVIEENQVSRPRIATPDFVNRLCRLDFTFLPRHYAERTP